MQCDMTLYLQCQYVVAQREESLAELAADLADVKAAYREQIEFLVGALEKAKTPPSSPAASLASGTQLPP